MKKAGTAIITRTKNRNLLLPRAIESVLGQVCQDWIHVIVNDGGDRDALESLLRPYGDRYNERLVVLHNAESLGMEAASNIGIAAVDSRFLLIHDDDDSLHPDFIAVCAGILERPPLASVRAVASRVQLIEESINDDGIKVLGTRTFRELGPLLMMDAVAYGNPCPPISLLFRRDVFEEIGRFDASLPVLGDWDFLIRLIEKYDVCTVNRTLANYHIRPALIDGLYANTVTADIDKHLLHDAFIRNRYGRSGSSPILAVFMLAHGSPDQPDAPLRMLARVSRRLDHMSARLDFVQSRMPISILRLIIRRLKRVFHIE